MLGQHDDQDDQDDDQEDVQGDLQDGPEDQDGSDGPDDQEDDALTTDPDSVPAVASRAGAERRVARSAPPVDVVLDLRQSLTWLLPFAMLLCAIIFVPARILAEEGLPRYRALQAEQVDLDAQNERMRREVRDLQREVQALRTDPSAIERIARDELGMVRPGEVIFQFSE